MNLFAPPRLPDQYPVHLDDEVLAALAERAQPGDTASMALRRVLGLATQTLGESLESGLAKRKAELLTHLEGHCGEDPCGRAQQLAVMVGLAGLALDMQPTPS